MKMIKLYEYKSTRETIKQVLKAATFFKVTIPEEISGCLLEIDKGYKKSKEDTLHEIVHIYETNEKTAEQCIKAYQAAQNWDYKSYPVGTQIAGIVYSILLGIITLHGKAIPSPDSK